MTDTERMQAFADAEHARQSVCTDCGRPGTPYEYHGVRHDGLIAYRGDRLCRGCADAHINSDGIDILVVDDRPSIPPYVYNTVRDRDLISIFVPPELRGIDGRDLFKPKNVRRRRPA